MYDPDGYSLWFCQYSLDKAGGFLQRDDLCSKYAFGKMPVIGSETPFKLKGL
jgi:elongation factor 1-gamma